MTNKVDPEHISNLYNHVGGAYNAAGLAMGCAPSTIARALDQWETTPKQEQKAKEALERLLAEEVQAKIKAAAPAQLLVSVPPMKLEAFQKVAGAMGLEVVSLA